jgi:hypothetical protein
MATTQEQHFGTLSHTNRRFLAELAAGSTTEALAGAGAAVLAIIGLAGIVPSYMMSIGVIVLGAAFICEGGVVMAKFADMYSHFGSTTTDRLEVEGGVSAEFLGGVAGVILGILALIGLLPFVLCAVAVLVFGASMLIGAGMTPSARQLTMMQPTESRTLEAGREATVAASGAEALVALAAVVLGILAICHIAVMPLVLIGVLVLGASFLLAGSAMSTQWLGGFRNIR